MDIKTTVELTGDALLSRLRLAAQPDGKKGLALRDLSDQQLAEVYNRLRLGQSLNRIAGIIQDKWAMHRTMPRKSLTRAITVFRDRCVPLIDRKPDRGKDEEYKQENKRIRDRSRYINKKLDVLGRLKWAIEKQTDRCERWSTLEKATPLINASRDWRLLADMCEKAIKLELDMGLLDRAPNKVILDHKVKFDQMIQSLDDGGQGLIEAAGDFLTEINQHLLTMERQEDGSYSIRPTTDAERSADLALGICGGLSARYSRTEGVVSEASDSFGDPGQEVPEDRG